MGLLLKIRKSEYELQMQKAETVLSRLESVRQKYQTLLSELNSDVVTGEDANFSLAEQMVQDNIKAAEQAIKEAQSARDTLAKSVAEYEESEAAGRQALSAGLQATEDALKAAIDVNYNM